MDMIFQLFDLNNKGVITKNDLDVVLFPMITPHNEAVTRQHQFIVYDIIDQEFDECDTDGTGRLNKIQFEIFIKTKKPQIIPLCQTLFNKLEQKCM